MSAYLKAKKLKPGARLAVVSPASASAPERAQTGVEALRAMGYEPVMMPHTLARGPLNYAGTARERAADLQSAFADKSIDGVICMRGGWGSAELPPLLRAEVVRANPKAFIGYSDHTSLHTWLQQECGLATFHGPMIVSDFAREGGVDAASWNSVLSRAAWEFDSASGMRAMQAGTARGVLRGGCISILAESLGTAYAFRAAEDTVLFLEDVGNQAYQWDRQLMHLRYAGVLDKVKGIVFGDMAQCAATAEDAARMEETLRFALRGFTGPVAIGLRSGHVNGANITLPLGVQAELDVSGEDARLRSLEAAEGE